MKNILYLGLDPSRYPRKASHYPIIQIKERPHLEPYFEKLPSCDYVIFTSRSTIPIYKRYAKVAKPCIVVGKATAQLAIEEGLEVAHIAQKEQAEGVLEIIQTLQGRFFFPHSSKARTVLQKEKVFSFAAYDTVATDKKIDISRFDAFVFTSPSTVEAFVELYGSLPDKELIAIGPITNQALFYANQELNSGFA